MAIGWLTVLKMVPWENVIKNAPRVADGAKKLWSTVAKKSSATEALPSNAHPAAPAAPSLAQLQQQLDVAVVELADLHQQMLASSELIRALAEQNTQLIKRVETIRLRVLALGAVLALLLVAFGVAITLTR